MSKKRPLPVKWILGALALLIVLAFWTARQTQNNDQGSLSAASNISTQNNFFQFLGSLIGVRSQNGPVTGRGNAPASQGMSSGMLSGWNPFNKKAPQETKPNAEQGSNATGQANNAENNQEFNEESNSEFNAENTSGIGTENNQEVNAQDNMELNLESPAEINPENNQEINGETAPQNDQETNSENNTGTNAETSQGNSPGNNPQGASGGSQAGITQCIPQCYPQCDPSCNIDNFKQYNLPTINHIPSDDAVSQSITQQNQQSSALSALLTTRQALVTPVIQQAQASKYQTVNAKDIPDPVSNPPSDEIKAKVQSHQLSFH